MAVTLAQLEELECGWVDLMREVGLDNNTIATNLGYTLVAEDQKKNKNTSKRVMTYFSENKDSWMKKLKKYTVDTKKRAF